MKAISILGAALVLAGCASPPNTPAELMNLQRDKVSEIRQTASVAVPVAYKNLLAKTQQCWRGYHRVVEADPFDPESGYARIALRTSGDMLVPRLVLTVIEIQPEGKNATLLTGRSLKGKGRTLVPQGDLPNLHLWAEGKDVACSG